MADPAGDRRGARTAAVGDGRARPGRCGEPDAETRSRQGAGGGGDGGQRRDPRGGRRSRAPLPGEELSDRRDPRFRRVPRFRIGKPLHPAGRRGEGAAGAKALWHGAHAVIFAFLLAF